MFKSLANAFLLTVLAQVPSMGNQRNPFVPPPGKTLLIVGQDSLSIEQYLEAVKIIPGGFAVYTSAEQGEGLTDEGDNGGGVQHGQQLLNTYPHSIIQLAIYMVDSCEKIYSGDLDENLDRISNWIKSANRPVFLRIGYEFDYPENNYPPEDYIRAYRYIVDRFRRQGVKNVAYVWHSYAAAVNRPHEDWYPGDNYVDWFALSYFEQPEHYMDVVADLAEKHKKPLMIAEASPWRLSTSVDSRAWEKWFVPMLKFVERRKVSALSYINCHWDEIPLFKSLGWGDSRVQSNPTLLQKWTNEISKEKYLKASPSLFKTLGYEQHE